ncbi:Flagellar protein FliS [Thalassocella blandensis]|nr:Flagellar protein FliS [Thalassocella blandensis]
MAVSQTKAAAIMAQNAADMTSHQVIALLLDGALERVSQAKHCISTGNKEDKVVLFTKINAILNGLRNCLNFNDGGDIADNLDALYLYMIDRIKYTSTLEEYAVMNEVEKLLLEIKQGWDSISSVEEAMSA